MQARAQVRGPGQQFSQPCLVAAHAGREVEVALRMEQVGGMPRPHCACVVQDQQRRVQGQGDVAVLGPHLCAVALQGKVEGDF